jgi:dihydroorotase
VEALREGLAKGTFKVISTDHAPHTEADKTGSIRNTAFGIVGIETSLALTYTELVESGVLSLQQMVEKMSWNPAQILGLPCGTLQEGHPADLIVVDTEETYAIDKNTFASKGHNTPFDGWKVRGRVLYTVCDAQIVYKYEA